MLKLFIIRDTASFILHNHKSPTLDISNFTLFRGFSTRRRPALANFHAFVNFHLFTWRVITMVPRPLQKQVNGRKHTSNTKLKYVYFRTFSALSSWLLASLTSSLFTDTLFSLSLFGVSWKSAREVLRPLSRLLSSSLCLDDL